MKLLFVKGTRPKFFVQDNEGRIAELEQVTNIRSEMSSTSATGFKPVVITELTLVGVDIEYLDTDPNFKDSVTMIPTSNIKRKDSPVENRKLMT